MNIQGVGNAAGHVGNAGGPPGRARGRQHVQEQKNAGKAAKTAPTDVTAPRDGATAAPGEAKVRGVIRLLQQGHFKGVADVRLRINFFDELSAIEHASLAQSAQDSVPELLASVNAPIDALLASGELDEEQTAGVLAAQEAFSNAIQDLVDDFANSGGTDTGALTAGLQLAFDSLLDSLTPLLTALAPDTGAVVDPAEPGGSEATPEGDATAVTVEATVEASASSLAVTVETELEPAPVPQEATVLSTFFEDLEGAFSSALAQFQGALESASTLPALSEPSGNGGAFEKFLAIYNEMRGVAPADAEPMPPAQGLDTMV